MPTAAPAKPASCAVAVRRPGIVAFAVRERAGRVVAQPKASSSSASGGISQSSARAARDPGPGPAPARSARRGRPGSSGRAGRRRRRPARRRPASPGRAGRQDPACGRSGRGGDRRAVGDHRDPQGGQSISAISSSASSRTSTRARRRARARPEVSAQSATSARILSIARAVFSATSESPAGSGGARSRPSSSPSWLSSIWAAPRRAASSSSRAGTIQYHGTGPGGGGVVPDNGFYPAQGGRATGAVTEEIAANRADGPAASMEGRSIDKERPRANQTAGRASR